MHASFLPAGWRELAPLLDAVLDAEPGDRERVLDAVSGGDPARRAQLAALVAEASRTLPDLEHEGVVRFAALATAEPSPLPAMLGDRYRTGREIGAGGMARVYLARDTRHDRDVAVKVIRPEVAMSLGRDRFLREIAIAARLRHPNIVPLYDSGDADGVLYFVMPFEAGPSLRARLQRDGALPIGEAISVLRDVARALKHAHANGVVHRDIKPDNVMLSGDAAVVADFGIAKAVSAAQVTATSAITQTGAGIGTPAYMAPEQAIGDPGADHRVDLYAFGCVAFELLAGHPPFHGMTPHQVVAAHIATAPPAVGTLRPDTPPALDALVARCLGKEASDRPADAAEVLEALEGIAGTTTAASPVVVRAAPSPARRRAAAAALLAAIAAGAYAIRGGPGARPAGEELSIAVLPIGNLGGDSTIATMARGLSDQVYDVLTSVPGVLPRSRTSARSYDNGSNVRTVAKTLGVNYLLTGDMHAEQGKWIITANLTHAADETEVWSQRFDVEGAGQLRIAEQIARGAAEALRRRFPNAIGAQPARRQTGSPEAYRNYVLGEELLARRGVSVSESAAAFRRAIASDSTFGPAWGGLSMALALYPYFQQVPPAEVAEELLTAAQRALQLDSTLAKPHIAMGLAYQHRYDFAMAGREFRAAVRLAPQDMEAHVQLGRWLLFTGETSEGLREFQLARAVDPSSALVLGWVSYAYFLLGQRDSALVISHEAQQGPVPNFTALGLGASVHLHLGLRDTARAYITRVRLPPGGFMYVLGALGDSASAFAMIRAGEATRPNPSTRLTARAFVYMGVGDTAQALTLLEQATDAHEMWPELQAVNDAQFDFVRDSPRFRALMQRVGLPPAAAIVPKGRKVPWR